MMEPCFQTPRKPDSMIQTLLGLSLPPLWNEGGGADVPSGSPILMFYGRFYLRSKARTFGCGQNTVVQECQLLATAQNDLEYLDI